MVRSSGGFTCTCSECETCAELALARANKQTREGTTNIFGKRVTGHPPISAPILAHFCLSGDDFDVPDGCAIPALRSFLECYVSLKTPPFVLRRRVRAENVSMRRILLWFRRLGRRRRILTVVLEYARDLAKESLFLLRILLLRIRILMIGGLRLRHDRLLPAPKQPREESFHPSLFVAGIMRLRARNKGGSVIIRARRRGQPVGRFI